MIIIKLFRLYYPLLLILSSCKAQNESSTSIQPKKTTSLIKNEALVPEWKNHFTLKKNSSINYTNVKLNSNDLRKSFTIENHNIKNKDSLLIYAGLAFTEFMIHQLLPYWYGTKWDFNGHTNIPQVGNIACGYFVSTTLKHMGLELNRYRMAQQSAFSEIKTIQNENVTTISNLSREDFADSCRNHFKDGLYILGMDIHVGYLYILNNEAYIIHSTYLPPSNVTVEKVSESDAISLSNSFWIGNITHNLPLMNSWISKKTIPVVMDKK